MIYKEKILNNIAYEFFDTGIIKDDDILIVALSGGMDSMCLFDAFYKLQSEMNYKLIALHVNHGIRGDEALRDEKFVNDYCASFNTRLIVKKVDAVNFAKKNNMTLEEAARKLRYDVFDKVWKEFSLESVDSNVYVLVAHHEKDQVETIIHNIVRGTGLKGLAGIKKESGYVLRPLLNIKKEDIEKYIDKYNIPYVNDSTNDDISYTRNYIRKEIIDKLKILNQKADEHIIELSKITDEINNFIEKESKKCFKNVLVDKNSKKIIIDLKKFRAKDKVIQKGIVREIFNQLLNTLKDITKLNVDDIIELSDKEKGGHLDLPYNVTVDKKQNELTFKKNDTNISMSRRKKK